MGYVQPALNLGACVADTVSMGSEIVLEYPNGRTVPMVVDVDIAPGSEFELYGRRWHALGPVIDWRSDRFRNKDAAKPILCKSLGRIGKGS